MLETEKSDIDTRKWVHFAHGQNNRIYKKKLFRRLERDGRQGKKEGKGKLLCCWWPIDKLIH